ncbi:MAG: 30S ribosomal protein S13 [Nanoarchaeota archaeon]|nr:30S ribosomal protein S13 [Nanoarchaeota archaeon]
MAKEVTQIIRVANVDFDGTRPVQHELTNIKGVGINYANLLCTVLGIPHTKPAGELSEQERAKIEDALEHPTKYGVPVWMMNRRSDPETGVSGHLVGSTLTFTRDNDIKLMRKIRSYKGVRHGMGLPVRGQSTKSNFRKNKGKVTGVIKKKDVPAAGPAKDAPKEKGSDKGKK